MRITGILDDSDAAAAILLSLGWFAYATDAQGARAPPPEPDPEAPELLFTSTIDGIVYELEPWEMARRQRLQTYGRQREQLAGIVVYDGEWNEAQEAPIESDARTQAFDESQLSPIPDGIDQRVKHEDHRSPLPADDWDQTPLATWARKSNQATGEDAIDQRPPRHWEEQEWDQSVRIWQNTPLAQWAQNNTWDAIDPIPPADELVFTYD